MRNSLKPNRFMLYSVFALLGIIVLLETLSTLKIDVAGFWYQAWFILVGVLVLLAVIDGVALLRMPAPKVQRELAGYLSLNQWSKVTLSFVYEGRGEISLKVIDHVPANMHARNIPFLLSIKGIAEVEYEIYPLERGDFHWDCCEFLLESRLKLWQQRRYVELESHSKVYPDFTKLYDANLSSIEEWIYHLGVRVHQRRGTGNDFHQLRDFIEGDPIKQIDWKATAKKRSPITKEYRDEKDQQVLFVLDCGQRMRIQEDGLSHFDHALNASLLLSYVALKQGDAVGLMTLAAQNDITLPPKKGHRQLNYLLNAVYNLKSTQKVEDYSKVVKKILTEVKRRSLIIFVTNLRYVESDETIKALKLLTRYHKVVIASLSETESEHIRKNPITDLESALVYSGNIENLLLRQNLHDRLLTANLPIIETIPKYFAPQLINHYLLLKRSGEL